MEQYFSKKPSSKDKDISFEHTIDGKKFVFSSNNGVFSKNAVDFGTELMIKTFLDNNTEEGLEGMIIGDAGCGIGIVGVIIGKFRPKSKLVMFDINERALSLARENLLRNKVENAEVYMSDLFSNENIKNTQFDFILTNPPIRAGKKTVFNMYEEAYMALKEKGALYVVIQKKQGADSSLEKLQELFGNCIVEDKKAGFRILKSVK